MNTEYDTKQRIYSDETNIYKKHWEHIESRKRFTKENQIMKKQQAQMLSSFRRIEKVIINCPNDMDERILLECMKHLPKGLK